MRDERGEREEREREEGQRGTEREAPKNPAKAFSFQCQFSPLLITCLFSATAAGLVSLVCGLRSEESGGFA